MGEDRKLQNGWVLIKMSEIIENIQIGNRPKGGAGNLLSGIPSISAEHFSYGGEFKFKKLKFIPNDFFKNLKKGKLQHQDILVVKDGATTGKSAFIDSTFPFKEAAVNEHTFILRPFDQIAKKLIFYYTLSKDFENYISITKGGSTIGGIKKGFIDDLDFPLPPLPEQERIVAKLDMLFGQLEQIKASLEKIPVLLKNFRQQVLTQAVTGKLTEEWRKGKELLDVDDIVNEYLNRNIKNELSLTKRKALERLLIEDDEYEFKIPANWKFKKLKKICSAFTYGTSSKSGESGDVPVLRMGNMQNGRIDWSNLKYTSDKKEIEKYMLYSGDVLFNRTNSPELVGKTSIYMGEMPAIYAGYLIKIHHGEILNSSYLNFVLNSFYAKKWCLEVKSDGVSQSNINAQKLSEFSIPFPSKIEQEEIVKRVESLFAKADIIQEQYETLKAKVDTLPQAILHKVFKGELVPQLDSDGDARELLEEIKRLKEEVVNKKSKKVGRKKVKA